MFDVPIKDIVDLVLRVDVGAYSFEAANPRHEHEWKVWKEVRLPAGKVLTPGSLRIRPTSSSIPNSWPSGCCAMPTSLAATASWPAQIADSRKARRRPRAPFDHVGEAEMPRRGRRHRLEAALALTSRRLHRRFRSTSTTRQPRAVGRMCAVPEPR